MFEPHTYRPRVAGPSRPLPSAPTEAAPAMPPMEEIFHQIGTVSAYSRVFRMDDIFDAVTRHGSRTFFLLFPGDVALERVMFSWSSRSTDAGLGNTSVDITIEQQSSFDETGTAKRALFDVGSWLAAEDGRSFILEPIERVEAFTPVLATIRCLNSTSPTITSFYEKPDLELWMTIHFLAGETA